MGACSRYRLFLMDDIRRKPNTEESKAFRGGLGGGEEFAPISAFPFLWCVTKRKKEKMRVFQDRKILRGMLLFVVVNIWNCYNMGMKKRINRKLRWEYGIKQGILRVYFRAVI